MPNYRNARLYTIRSHHTDKIYIGSTCNKLPHRLHCHRNDYKLFKEGKHHYVTSFEIIQYDDNYIELLCDAPCASKEELHKLEGQQIRANENCVNKNIAGRTKKEYYRDNKEQILIKTKQYYEENKEHQSEKKKEYYENNKEHIDQYRKQWHEDNKEHLTEYHKKYYEENKEQYGKLAKEYYEKNKETSKQRSKKNYHDSKNVRECLCGSSYNCGSKHRSNKHYASERHKLYVKDFYTRLNEQLTQ